MKSLERVSAASAGEAAPCAYWLEDDDEEVDVDVEEDMLLGSEDSTSTSTSSRGGKEGHGKARSAGGRTETEKRALGQLSQLLIR